MKLACISSRAVNANETINDIIAHFVESVNIQKEKLAKVRSFSSKKRNFAKNHEKILQHTDLLLAIPHKDCAIDASSNFSSDETKSGVNTC
ncbi:hypothetical protein LIQ91_01500, partial [Ruminococcus callidus]|uniref:hypothetical protein n=1 Tax=Ruminococcus callidus TaxID=40519 RepID=UPI001D02BB05